MDRDILIREDSHVCADSKFKLSHPYSLINFANSLTLCRRDGGSLQRIAPDEIFVQDVVGALNTTDTFDFLTDNHLASDL